MKVTETVGSGGHGVAARALAGARVHLRVNTLPSSGLMTVPLCQAVKRHEHILTSGEAAVAIDGEVRVRKTDPSRVSSFFWCARVRVLDWIFFFFDPVE